MYRKGWKFTALIEERDVAYFPAVQMGTRQGPASWLARFRRQVVCCHGARFFPLALRIQSKRFGPGDGHFSIKIMSIMIFVVLLVYQGRMEDLFPRAAVVWSEQLFGGKTNTRLLSKRRE